MLSEEHKLNLVGAYIKGFMDRILGRPVTMDDVLPEADSDKLVDTAREFVDANLNSLAQLYIQDDGQALRLAHQRGSELAEEIEESGGALHGGGNS